MAGKHVVGVDQDSKEFSAIAGHDQRAFCWGAVIGARRDGGDGLAKGASVRRLPSARLLNIPRGLWQPAKRDQGCLALQGL